MRRSSTVRLSTMPTHPVACRRCTRHARRVTPHASPCCCAREPSCKPWACDTSAAPSAPAWFGPRRAAFGLLEGRKTSQSDGAPESRDKTMTIGTLTSWNFGSRTRSREYQYTLHGVTCCEKDPVMEQIWEQHSEEMLVLEGNTLTIDGSQLARNLAT